MESWAPIHNQRSSTYPTNLYQQLIQDGTPEWMIQHHKTHISSWTTTLLQRIFDQPARAVSDVSFKDNVGAAAAIIETIDQDTSLVNTCHTPINIQEDGDPYRTKLMGILLNLHIIYSSENLLQTNGSFII